LYDFGQTVEQRLQAEQDERTGERKLLWLIDIFLYPVSVPGLTNLAIFIGVPLLVSAVTFLLGPLAFTLTIPIIIVNILIRLYMYWYFAECIRDSGIGGLRAPRLYYSFFGAGWFLLYFYSQDRFDLLDITGIRGFLFPDGLTGRCYVQLLFRF